jgi:hypothetical protein
MENYLPNGNYFCNSRSALRGCMVKQKLELKFVHGIWLGILVSAMIFGIIIDRRFINRDALTLNRIYLDGRLYKMCEIK